MGLEVNRVKYNASWTLVRLKEVCNRISDGTHFTPTYVKEGVPFISVKDIYNGEVHFDKCKYIDKLEHQELIKRCYPEKDDILITKSGTIGRMALVPESPDFSLFVSVALIKNKKDIISSRFLKYCLENFLNSINISQDIKGGLLKNFHLEDIRETIVPLVSVNEQQLILSKIEELLSEVDKGVEELETAQQQLKVYRQAILKWGFEGKLTNKNVKQDDLPEGWKKSTIGEVCTSVEYGSAIKSKVTGKVPVLRMGNIQNGMFEWDDLVYTDDDKEIDKYLLRKNDVLFNRTNSAELVGKTAIYKGERPAIFAGYLIRINRIEERIDASYLTYYLNSKSAKSYGNSVRSFGVNQSNINGTKLKTYPLPLPPLAEQQQIVQEIESRLSVCDKIEETITNSLKQTEALRQSILKKAFEGKLILKKVYEPRLFSGNQTGTT